MNVSGTIDDRLSRAGRAGVEHTDVPAMNAGEAAYRIAAGNPKMPCDVQKPPEIAMSLASSQKASSSMNGLPIPGMAP
jgi:hypothetical protein